MSTLATIPTPSAIANRRALSAAASKALDTNPAEIIKRWLASICEGSRRVYGRALSTFTRWAIPASKDAQDGLRLLAEVGAGPAHELLVGWRDAQLGRLAPATVASNVSAICSLLRVARRAGVVAFVVDGVAPKRERVLDRSGPSRGQVERLLGFVDDRAEAGDRQALRDAAVLRLLYNCAMRRNEVCTLQLADVNLTHANGPQIRALRKGHRQRRPVLVSDNTSESLSKWIAVRGAAAGPLFHRLNRADHSKPLSGESIRALVASWARAAGVRGAVRPHGLRHSSASECARRGSLAELQALGSWKSLSAASSYIDERQDVRRAALRLVDA